MNAKYLNKLEYNKILEILSAYATTYIGKDLCLNLMPSNIKDAVEKLLSETTAATILIIKSGNIPISKIENIDIHIKMLESFGTLSAKALLDIANILRISNNLKKYAMDAQSVCNTPLLQNYFDALYVNKDVENTIFSSIIDENTIADTASEELNSIRKNIRKLEENIKSKLSSFINSNAKYLMENLVTIRSSRFVVPVKQEYRSNVKGFIHDISSSGATVFIEPISIFELNNDLNNLKIEENIEIEKILQKLSSLFYPITEEIKNTINIIGQIDLIFAKAKYSRALNAVEPVINDEKYINLISAKQPLIDAEKVVPIDIEIGQNFRTLVITGPNTGGKTVSLKTVGLLALMAMSGLHIPAKEKSSIYVFDYVFADIGDEQSIQESLSTFSSHMLNIIDILDNATSNSLVLLDELGSGTDPIEGSSLAISILQEFYKKGCLTLSTTHYPEIKNYALVTEGFENASSEFDVDNLKPTYKLLLGVPGKSNAFAISKKLGLNENILKNAESLVNTDVASIEDLLKSISDSKALIESEKKAILDNSSIIKNLKENLEKENSTLDFKQKEIIEKARLEARNILIEAKSEADDIIKEMHNTPSIKDLNSIRNKINNSIKEIQNNIVGADDPVCTNDNIIPPADITIGMDVFVTTLNSNGTVLSLPNKSNQVLVQCGSIKTNVDVNKLLIAHAPVGAVVHGRPLHGDANLQGGHGRPPLQNISHEINVIGYNTEEAIFAIDKYLDNAYIARLPNVRIVHGKGTGTLRKNIHSYLKTHPQVKSYRVGVFGEGEMGVTVVELK